MALAKAAAATLAAAVVVLAVAACGLVQPGGPLANDQAGGQPAFAVSGGTAQPGQASDDNVFVVNSAPDPVTLVSASLIPIKGHPTGRLVLLKVPVPLKGIAGGRGWPIPGISAKPFRGARLPHGLSFIIFGFAGTRVGGIYMTAGLRIVYRYHGQLYTMLAWCAADDCVQRNWRTPSSAACNRADDIVRRATEQLAGI